MHLRPVHRQFRDVVLTWRGTLDDPRIFPAGYAERMTQLAQAMLAYFNGEVDVVGHYCGIESRKGYHLPSIVIQARSVSGNRKACQQACQTLGETAASLFAVRFDHASLAIEEIRDEDRGEQTDRVSSRSHPVFETKP